MPSAAYEYMTRPEVIWCCDACIDFARTTIKEATHPRNDVEELRSDLNTTMNSVKALMNDFYCFMNGQKSREVPQSSGSTAQNWVHIPQQPVKPIKEIILEASAEQKREQEEESRRRKNIVIHRAPEDNQQGEEERLKEDDELVDSLLCEIELPDLRAKKCKRLGKKPTQDDPNAKDRPLMVTFETEEEVAKVLQNLTKLKGKEKRLVNLRVSPDRSMKDREIVRELVQRAKNLTANETGDYVHLVRGKTIIRVRARKKHTNGTSNSGSATWTH